MTRASALRLVVPPLLIVASLAAAPHARLNAQAQPPLMRSETISEPGRTLRANWRPSAVPGGEIAFFTETITDPAETFFLRYRLMGVVGGSLHISQQGARRNPTTGSAPDDPSFRQTLYVEEREDGTFAFVPDPLIGVGYLSIRRDPENPGHYLVRLVRR